MQFQNLKCIIDALKVEATAVVLKFYLSNAFTKPFDEGGVRKYPKHGEEVHVNQNYVLTHGETSN